MSDKKTLEDFVNGHWATMCVLKQRYGGGYVAFIGHEEYISMMAASHTGGDQDMIDLCHGVMLTDWYPVGYGDTIEDAVGNLRKLVESYLAKEDNPKELWERLCDYTLVGLYYYHNDHYDLNPLLKADKLPDWFKKFDTITTEKLERFFEEAEQAAKKARGNKE